MRRGTPSGHQEEPPQEPAGLHQQQRGRPPSLCPRRRGPHGNQPKPEGQTKETLPGLSVRELRDTTGAGALEVQAVLPGGVQYPTRVPGGCTGV